MKKVTYFYIGCSIVFFSLLSTAALAWKNGLHTIGTYQGTVGEDPIPIYKKDYSKSITPDTLRQYYGTHDWIAESALELLYNKLGRPTSGFLYQLWNEYNPDNLRCYFLFGTEMPDHPRVPSGLKTRCNFRFINSQFSPTGHNKLLFHDDPTLPNYKHIKDDSACTAANNIYDSVKLAFREKDCQAAAVFIGALMHVISDATYFYHVLENTDTDYYTWHVLHVTFRTWEDAKGVDRANEFFNLAEVKGKLTPNDILNPYQATLLAGKDTRFGSLLYQDAEYLLYSDPSDFDRQFWEDIDGYWTDHSQEHSWTQNHRPVQEGTSAKKYFDTVEHNLNQAVYYCATVLNYLINLAGYTACDCGSSSGNNPYPPEPGGDRSGEGVREGIQLSIDTFNGLLIFSGIGLMATALALALLEVASLEKFLIN